MISEVLKERIRKWHDAGFSPQETADLMKRPLPEVQAVISTYEHSKKEK
jgi:predicted transcriptional regulator